MTFAFSILFHLGFAGSVMWFDLLVQWHEETLRRSQYQVLMLPRPQIRQRKVLYYDFRKPVPEVAAERPFGAAKTAQGAKDAAARTLIAQSPRPASTKQLIWQPKHPEPIPADIPAPNLATLSSPSPPAPKAPLKSFIAPPADRPKTGAPLMLEPPPPVLHAAANLRDEHLLRELTRHDLASAPRPPLKQFTPPASQSNPGSGPAKLIEPPPVPAQPGAGGSVQAVIVGLNPADRFSAPVPEGSRSAQFARAPTAGLPSSGSSSSPDALRVPGVTARASPGRPMEVRSENAVPERRTVTEIVFPPVNRTMSAPLRPSSRIVPATVDAKFANRDVYALVIPSPRLAGYSGDWVLWFAPHQTDSGARTRIQAPIPARKQNWGGDNGVEPDSNNKGSVQFQAIIDSKGSVLSPQIVRGLSSESFRRRAVAELRTWEFKPALRNGEPIDVDVVLEIPFEFRPTVSQTR